jgi:hypothetical protein
MATPLAYVTREDVFVLAHNRDPSNNYNTVQEEMVAHMPHIHPAYHEDNITVWDIIRDSIHDTEVHSRGSNDVKDAVMDMRPIWPSPLTTWVTLRMKPWNAADNKILNTFYGGEKNRFNWTRYVSVHKECHNDLKTTGTALPEDNKVWHCRMLEKGLQLIAV